MSTEPGSGIAALQARFASALFDDAEAVPAGITSHTAPRPAKRFNIYRNNVLASLIGALRARFPVVERLVGEEFFRAMARLFVEIHPPRSPALLDYGGDFIPFLRGFGPARELPYLPDVALIEWLRQRAYHAADAEPLAPGALAAIAPDDLPAVRFALHPSTRLFASDCPALSIWEANAQDGDVGELRDDLGAEAALIVRPRLEVVVIRLTPGGYAFAEAIADARPLAEAAERASACDPQFHLPETLGALLGAGALSRLSLNTGDLGDLR
jgi:hypothetical protein